MEDTNHQAQSNPTDLWTSTGTLLWNNMDDPTLHDLYVEYNDDQLRSSGGASPGTTTPTHWRSSTDDWKHVPNSSSINANGVNRAPPTFRGMSSLSLDNASRLLLASSRESIGPLPGETETGTWSTVPRTIHAMPVPNRSRTDFPNPYEPSPFYETGSNGAWIFWTNHPTPDKSTGTGKTSETSEKPPSPSTCAPTPSTTQST